MSTVTDGFADLQEAIDAVEAERAGLDDQFEEARSLIEEQYRLSETERERQQLEDLLSDLHRQRTEAEAQLATGYNRARQNVLGRLEETTGAAPEAIERAASDFESSYSAVRDAERQAAQDTDMAGIPVGAGAQASGAGERIEDAAGAARQAAAGREQILQDDLAWLADTLQAEGQAQVGETRRLGQQLGAAARRDHDRRVSDRIQQERMAQAQQLGQLQDTFAGRRFQLGDTERQLMAQLGQMRQQAGESAAQRALQRSLAAGAGGGGGGARGGASGGASGPTAAGVREDDLATDPDLRSQLRTYANRALNDPRDFPEEYQGTSYRHRPGEPPNRRRTAPTGGGGGGVSYR